MNCLYEKDRKYSSLYEYVEFINVCAEGMNKFTEIFDFNDMTKSTWETIVRRLNEPIKACFSSTKHERTKKRLHIEIGNKNNEFDGILNYLQNNGNIRDEVNITCSSINVGDPFNLLQYNNKQNYFQTQDETNSWICFEFKNHAVIPSGYIIRSYCDENESHPKTWKFEGSNDLQSWATLDSQTNNDSLRGGGRVHLFPISGNEDKDKPFKYLRIRQTGSNWYEYENGSYYDLLMNTFEIYGRVI